MISIIIPFYPVDQKKYEVLQQCTKSLPDVEKIIVWNRREGYAKAINEGCKCASGDYFLIMNDDVILKSGNIEDLCVPNTVVSPTFNGKEYAALWGSCFCVPRTVWEQIGGMDEQYTISYFDDDDLIASLQANNIPMKSQPTVVFDHPKPGRTLESMPDRNVFYQENCEKFRKKWGRLP